jgi:hypothetical protein
MSWNTALGVFLVVGLISFAVLNLAEWLLPGRVAHIGWTQIAVSSSIGMCTARTRRSGTAGS